jgi:hypothetical protein
MSTGVFAGAALDPDVSFGDALWTVTKNVTGELTLYGVQFAGEALGIDPKISSLAGIGMRSSLVAGLGTFGMGGGSPGDWWDDFVEEATRPTNLALAFNIAGDALGLDPLINNMMITAIMGALDGFNEDPENRILGMFKGMLDNFWNASIRALTFGLYDPIQTGWNSEWQKDYYLMNLTDFIDVVEEGGIAAALEHYLTNIFRDEAIRVINQRGGIADFLTGDAEMVQEGIVWLKRINVTSEDKLYLDPATDNIVGRDYGNIRERGQYGVNPRTGGFGLIKGMIEETTPEGTRMVYYISNSTVIDKMEVYGTSGTHIEIIARNPETGLKLNEKGVPIGGIVADFEKGKLYTYEIIGDYLNFEINFDSPNVNIQSVLDVDWPNVTEKQKEDLINYYLLMNGICNPNPYGSPRYMFNFKTELANADPLPREDIALIPLYNGEIPKFDATRLIEVVGNPLDLFEDLISNGYVERLGDTDRGKLTKGFFDLRDSSEMILDGQFEEKREEIFAFLNDLAVGLFGELGDRLSDGIEWCLKTEEVAARILQGMNEAYKGVYPPDITSVCHSGSGDPFIYLLNALPSLDVKSVVFVGAPIRGSSQILNTNVETVINIYGENDDVFRKFNNKFRDDFDGTHLFDNNPGELKEIAIELKGVGHDYFYDPGEPREGDDLRKKSSRFIAEITYRANDINRLNAFLGEQILKKAVVYNENGRKYVVDLEKVVYENEV